MVQIPPRTIDLRYLVLICRIGIASWAAFLGSVFRIKAVNNEREAVERSDQEIGRATST